MRSSKKDPLRKKGLDLYLSIISRFQDGENATQVSKSLGMAKSALSYHLKKLRVLDVIRYISYGVWEVQEEHVHRIYDTKEKKSSRKEKEVQISDPSRSTLQGDSLSKRFEHVGVPSQDSVATHGLLLTLKLPGLARWHPAGRRQYLESRKIPYRVVPQGERLDGSLTLGWTIHLTNKSVVAYAPKGKRWYASTAFLGFRLAFMEYLRVIKALERLLGVSLGWSGRYKVKSSREHHALLRNALAEQYTRRGERLYIADERGIWALIDASIDPGEFETIRAGREGRSANEAVQDFFNSVKVKKLTLYDIERVQGHNALMIGELAKHDKEYAENISAHVNAIKTLAEQQERQTKILERLEKML